MKVYEVNQTKVYAVGEYNKKELCDFNDIVESIKQHDYGVNLVIAKVPTSDDLCEKIKEELLSIDDQGFKDLLNGKLSETTKFGIYSNILDVAESFKNYSKRFNSILSIGNISKVPFDPNRPNRSFIEQHGIYSLYKDYCKSCLLSKYNNKIRINSEVYIDKDDFTTIRTKIRCDNTEEYLDINIDFEDNNLVEYAKTISEWEEIVYVSSQSPFCDNLYVFTVTKDNLDEIIDKINYALISLDRDSIVGIITDLPKEELDKYKVVLEWVEVHRDMMSLLCNIL